ncbi:MAG TPA: two-component sensor histidine kinase [Treponema sp.]|nr:two-component sensor histidine kinase [Treponema sp.]
MGSGKPRNIKRTLLASYLLIILVMILPTVYSMVVSRVYTGRYNRIIEAVNRANALGKMAKNDVCNEVWGIVSGLQRFEEGRQMELLRTIRTGIDEMMENASEQNMSVLEVASRTEQTLESYVGILEFQMRNGYTVAQNESIMEEIRGVASLLYDIFQNFIISEIQTASDTNRIIHRSFIYLTCIQLAICAIVLGISLYTSFAVSDTIQRPIHNMEQLSFRIASGDLSARAEQPHVKELDHLAENLNTMAGKIQGLIDENVREQKNLQKAEMKTLQAQITPHFLYNTFDTIIWLSEAGRTEDVIGITRAFSHFFRISLSKGHEWITVEQELEHVKSYLTIQKIRYENILSYEILADEGIGSIPMLKLLLQPLVENAIYHGIKNKRGRGHICVCARRVPASDMPGGGIEFKVADDGIGFTEERLAAVRAELQQKAGTEELHTVYGLYNVNKRLKLYYDVSVPFSIESEFGRGSCVSFTVPVDARGGQAER